ncbi:hypothetical protein [Haliscomenobacter sp.]|uniref:hypothetical protein n=1 Tax=Haliscomenobacter sp. TaxID=2717303 RepID=UPI00336519A3
MTAFILPAGASLSPQRTADPLVQDWKTSGEINTSANPAPVGVSLDAGAWNSMLNSMHQRQSMKINGEDLG